MAGMERKAGCSFVLLMVVYIKVEKTVREMGGRREREREGRDDKGKSLISIDG